MTIAGRRIVACLLAVLTILILAEHRLSDGGSPLARESPDLWEQVQHGDEVTATLHVGGALDCPLVLSVDRRSPFSLTPVDDGVLFDLDGDGDLDRVAWTEASSNASFLAVDRNGDGRITSGRELFGRHTAAGAGSGPSALATMAAESMGGTSTGSVDPQNPLFFRLLLWTDANHNGLSEAAELRPASDVVSYIGLGFVRHHRKDRHGNESQHGGFMHLRRESNGLATSDDVTSRRRMYDVCLVSRSAAR